MRHTTIPYRYLYAYNHMTYYRFDGIESASAYLNIEPQQIRNAISIKCRCHGYIFKWVDVNPDTELCYVSNGVVTPWSKYVRIENR